MLNVNWHRGWETKWALFCKRHFQMHLFSWMKLIVFWIWFHLNLFVVRVKLYGSMFVQVMDCHRRGDKPLFVYPVHWRIDASPEPNELIKVCEMIQYKEEQMMSQFTDAFMRHPADEINLNKGRRASQWIPNVEIRRWIRPSCFHNGILLVRRHICIEK